MDLEYTTQIKIRLAICFTLVAIGLPYWFITGGTVLGLIAMRLVAMFFHTIGTIGSHRWLTHNSFKPSKFGARLMLACQVLNGMGTLLWYVISHTEHHRHSDTDKDPQTPKRLTFWDMWWGRYFKLENYIMPKHFIRNKEAMFVNKHYWKLFFAFNLVLALIDLPTALLFCPLNFIAAWLGATIVNYHGHNAHHGRDNIHPINLSRWCMLLSFSGEELHKNHHDNPSSYHFDGNGRKDPSRWIVEYILMAERPKKNLGAI